MPPIEMLLLIVVRHPSWIYFTNNMNKPRLIKYSTPETTDNF